MDLCSLVPSLTLRQLQWWDEQGFLVASHDGRNRQYSMEDALAVAVITDLRRRKGIPLQRLRPIVGALRHQIARNLIRLSAGKRAYLATDGRSLWLDTNADRLLEILSNSGRTMAVVNVSESVKVLEIQDRNPSFFCENRVNSL